MVDGSRDLLVDTALEARSQRPSGSAAQQGDIQGIVKLGARRSLAARFLLCH